VSGLRYDVGMRAARAAILVVAALAWACGGTAPQRPSPRWPARTLAVWVGAGGLDELTLGELRHAGVDRLVAPLGTVTLADDVPVLRGVTPPPVPPGAPLAVAFRLDVPGGELDPDLAPAVWRAVSDQAAAVGRPQQVVVDLARIAEGTDAFLQRLAAAAGVPIVPAVAPGQLADPRLPAVARGCGRVLVVAAGDVPAWRPGEEALPPPWDVALEPLAAAGVPWRLGVVLRPRTDPSLEVWGEDLDPLTEPEVAEVLTRSPLDRSFRLRRAVRWSGRDWKAGTTVAISWLDTAELDAALGRAERVVVPPLDGWDLLWLPPPAPALGISREALVAYLRGDGPGPRPAVRVERSGLTVRVTLANPTPFPTAVSRFGNWVELAAPRGLVAENRGAFDAIVLGRRDGDTFRRDTGDRIDAVRLHELYLAPGEEVTSGTLRLRSRRDTVRVRWHLVLGDGRELRGGG